MCTGPVIESETKKVIAEEKTGIQKEMRVTIHNLQKDKRLK